MNRTFEEIERLVEDNMQLAKFMADKADDFDYDEALSICMGALYKAALRFQPGRGQMQFGTYAGKMMSWALSFERRKMRCPSRGYGVEKVWLDDDCGGESEPLYRVILDENAEIPSEVAQLSDDIRVALMALGNLPARDQKILRLRYGFEGEPLRQRDVGNQMGFTHQAAHQAECAALRRARKILKL